MTKEAQVARPSVDRLRVSGHEPRAEVVRSEMRVFAEDGEVARGVVARCNPQFSKVRVRALSFRFRIRDDHLDAGQKLNRRFHQCATIVRFIRHAEALWKVP